MSDITDAVDRAGTQDAGERALGFAICATSAALVQAARAALDAGEDARAVVARCLPGAPILAWPFGGEPATEGVPLAASSYRGHVLAAFDRDAGRALLGTMRLADELPLGDQEEATACHSLVEAARLSLRDVQAGADLEELVGDDVEPRLVAITDVASVLDTPVLACAGEAVIVVDRAGNVALATTGPEPLIVDRVGKPWLALVTLGEPVLAVASFLHAAIDRALDADAALRAPRLVLSSRGVHVEPTFPPTVRDALRERGHAIDESPLHKGGILLAAITQELYREVGRDPRLAEHHTDHLKGDPPPKPPAPARGIPFSVGSGGH